MVTTNQPTVNGRRAKSKTVTNEVQDGGTKTVSSSADWNLKDSGQRRDFGTGSVRDVRDGKGRFDLLPAHALFLVARQFEEGAKKYGERNWEKGQPLSVYLDSALRHIFKHIEGHRDEPHDVAAAWNLLTFLDTKARIERGQLPAHLNDLPPAIAENVDIITSI